MIAQPRVRLVHDLSGELSAEPRLADAGLAREQHDLAGAGPGLAQTVAQQGALRRPADEVGEPAARGLEPAFGYGEALDHEGFDRLGEALRRLATEVAQPEQVGDQAAGHAGEDDLSGLRKRLQARREVGVSPTTACSCAEPSPTRSPTTTSPVAMPIRTASGTVPRVSRLVTAASIWHHTGQPATGELS